MTYKNHHTDYKGKLPSNYQTGYGGVPVDSKRAEEKEWITQYDEDKDGRISRDELREAFRANGAWFPGRKAKFAVQAADKNRDGFIDDDTEIATLVEFAEKQGIRIKP